MRFELKKKKKVKRCIEGKKHFAWSISCLQIFAQTLIGRDTWWDACLVCILCSFFLSLSHFPFSFFFPFSLASYFRCKIHVDTLRMRASEGTNYDRQLPRWNVTFANIFWFECRQALKVLYPDAFLPSPMRLPRVSYFRLNLSINVFNR